MPNLNEVILMGNTTVDPELNTTQSGIMRCTFQIAINYWVGDEKRTTYVPITCWRDLAENTAEYVDKGDPVAVVGRLEISQWEDSDGNNRKTTRVVARNVQFIGSGDSGNQQQPNEQGNKDDNEDPPFAT